MAQKAFSMGLALFLMAMMWAHFGSAKLHADYREPVPLPQIYHRKLIHTVIFLLHPVPSVVQTQAQCLCTVLNGGPQRPFAINQTQALTLPGACRIQTPPPSQCKAVSAGAPLGAPAPAPSATPSAAAAPSGSPSVPTPTTPSTPRTPSVPKTPAGSKIVPTTGQTSSASSTKFASSILFLVFPASAFSTI